MSEDFFSAIPAFEDFSGICNEKNYFSAPSDWVVIITDVRDSTKAIMAGNYRRVNIAGASAIAGIQNLAKGIDIPFSFGGDGSTILIPPSVEAPARSELSRIKKFFMDSFSLDLRIGMVTMEEIRKRGSDIQVAKYKVGAGINLAMFRGGGIKTAEDLVKHHGFELPPLTAEEAPNLDGLSCRWEPMNAKNGLMLSLLASSKNNDPAIYRDILEKINSLTRHDSAPVKDSNLIFKWPPQGMIMEARMKKGNFIFNFIKVLGFTVTAYLLLRFKKKAAEFDGGQYRKDVIQNADFRKFDDMLRMVLDCSEQEVENIEKYLEGLRQQGKIFYGLHKSGSAIMTCLVFSTQSQGHTHFIDGNDGGYAIAALQMKKQIQEAGKA